MRKTLPTEFSRYLSSRQSYRAWSLAARDGVISTAGILLGFAGAGAGDRTLVIAATAAVVAGMLGAGGACWSEAAAEREQQLSALEEEMLEHGQQRDVKKIELVEYYERKGLDRDLAINVASQLMIRSPLKAGLESEHGILDLTSQAEVFLKSIGGSIAYGLGAAIPFAITFLLPVQVETWVILLTMLFSLTLISLLGARAGHMNARRTIARTILVGVVTLTVSYLIGDIAF